MRSHSQPFESGEVCDIGLSGIAVLPYRMRKLREELVDSLAESMSLRGLLQPIVIRPADGTGYYLVAGLHRLQAARKLKWESISARVSIGLDSVTAELAEIDENLIRGELSAAERALHTDRRKELYEKQNPETKHGANQHTKRSRKICDSSYRFTKETAKATGRSERLIQLDAARGRNLGQDDLSHVIGTALDKGEELDALAKLKKTAPEKCDALIARAAAGEGVSAKTEAKKAQRAQKEITLADKQRALPDKKYGVIVADPEWRFEPYSRDTGMDRAADNHYPTSPTDDICARDTLSIAAPDCVLFLWATAPMLPDAIKVMGAWGFTYKTHMIWHKLRSGSGRGSGYWVTGEHELLLIGSRGHVPAPATAMCGSVIAEPVGEHSAKPERFLEIIEANFPNLPKIELNRRGPVRTGWDAWGFECDDGSSPDAHSPDNQSASVTTAVESVETPAGLSSPQEAHP